MNDDAIEKLLERARREQASLRPAPAGFVWRASVSGEHQPEKWGYSEESVTVRITWTLEQESDGSGS